MFLMSWSRCLFAGRLFRSASCCSSSCSRRAVPAPHCSLNCKRDSVTAWCNRSHAEVSRFGASSMSGPRNWHSPRQTRHGTESLKPINQGRTSVMCRHVGRRVATRHLKQTHVPLHPMILTHRIDNGGVCGSEYLRQAARLSLRSTFRQPGLKAIQMLSLFVSEPATVKADVTQTVPDL